jgi:hypothetical protein
MAYRFGKAFIDLKIDSSTIGKSVGIVKGAFRLMGNAVGGILKGITSAIGFVTSALKKLGIVLAAIGTLSIRTAMKQIEAEMKLKRVLEATQNAAGFTYKEMLKMASGLSQISRHGDEAIISMQALLATFLNISGPVFKETLERALDIAEVFGGDLKMSVVQLGKALNDPITGYTALKRTGISFSEEQIRSIKLFTEQNNLMAAQRVILDELKAELGGVSEAIASGPAVSFAKLKNAIGDFMEIMQLTL